MKRRASVIILALTIVFTSIIPALDSGAAVYAYTGKTRDEAIEWVQSQIGVGIDYDGVYGNQCVDLIKAYYHYLGVDAVRGNGKDYANNSLPEGWSRVEGGTPEKGDILVYGESASNEYGHVAIYESDYETYHQNFNGHAYVEKVTSYRYNGLSNSYWGYIRPDWAGAAEPTEAPASPHNVRTSDGGNIYKTDSFISFAWDASPSTDNYSVYMLKDGEELFSADVGKLLSYTSAPLEEGRYTFCVKAGNSVGYSEAAQVEFTVNNSSDGTWWSVNRSATITDINTDKGQEYADLDVVLEYRFTDRTKKLRADWYAGYNGQVTAETPVFSEEKTGDGSAASFTYSAPLTGNGDIYDTYECVIRELGINDESETTLCSEVVYFKLIRKTDPADPGNVEPGNEVKPSYTAPIEKVCLKSLKIIKPKTGKKKATVRWKKVSAKDKKAIQGIEVQWSLNGFKNIAGTKTVNKTKTSVTIKGLKSKKKYWVRIRTYKKVGNIKRVSAWRNKTVKVK